MLERRAQPPQHGQVVGCCPSRYQYPVAQPQHPDSAQQGVQFDQRPQIVLGAGRAAQSMPGRPVLLHRPHHGARKTPARRQFHPVGKQIDQQPHRFRHLAGHPTQPLIGVGAIEWAQPVTHPVAHRLMLGMPGIVQRVEQLGVAARPAAVFRRAGAAPIDTTRLCSARAEHLDVVAPAVAEVVAVLER